MPVAARPIAERFWGKVDTDGPVPEFDPSLGQCWLWTGALMKKGYGKIGVDGKRGGWRLAHRVSLELHDIQLVHGLVVDHLCRVRRCVRPSHMEQVTELENRMRGDRGNQYRINSTARRPASVTTTQEEER